MRLLATSLAFAFAVLPIQARADQFDGARADIMRYCSARKGQDQSACVAKQKAGLGRFVTIMAGFDDPKNAVARHCMTRAKVGHFINWVLARQCMQTAAKGVPLGGRLRLP